MQGSRNVRVPRHLVVSVLAVAGTVAAALSASAQPGSASTTPGSARLLEITPAQQQQLTALYAGYLRIPAADISGSGALGALASPGSEDWALITFTPAPAAPQSVNVMLQDGNGTGIFSSSPGGHWQLAGLGGEPLGCATTIPAAVLQVWGLAACPPATASPAAAPSVLAPAVTPASSRNYQLAEIAESQVGRSDNPAAHNFDGLDCNPYTAIEVSWASRVGCHTDSSFLIKDASELWCADFTKWVWQQAGVRSDLGVLTGSAATFYTWGRDHHESMPRDPKNPQVGDAVVFYPPHKKPNGNFADHVGIVTAVNRNGTVNLVNGDFLESSGHNIHVEADNDVSLGPWSAANWARGESWIFVSPELSASTHDAAELVGAQSHRCVDTYRARFANGSREEIYTCHHGVGQSWTYTSRGELTVDRGRYCLQVKDGETGNSAVVELWRCTGKPDQQWTFGPGGSVVGSASGRCLNVAGGSTRNGARLIIYACLGTPNETWSWS
jgi:hypothetical protein